MVDSLNEVNAAQSKIAKQILKLKCSFEEKKTFIIAFTFVSTY
jgi:hypothetical protein